MSSFDHDERNRWDHDLTRGQEERGSRFRELRREWIPSIKALLATSVDIFGDWLFFIRTRNAEGLDEFEKPLFFFCIVSSVLGCFTLVRWYLLSLLLLDHL